MILYIILLNVIVHISGQSIILTSLANGSGLF